MDSYNHKISEQRYIAIESYLRHHYKEIVVNDVFDAYHVSYTHAQASEASGPFKKLEKQGRLDGIIKNLEASFTEHLLGLIDDKGWTDVEVYKKASIDRRLFSKIRKDRHYKPSKATAIALAIALELNYDQTQDLLGKAGYTLSRSSKFDVIIEFFIAEETYNILEINQALYAFDQPILG